MIVFQFNYSSLNDTQFVTVKMLLKVCINLIINYCEMCSALLRLIILII